MHWATIPLCQADMTTASDRPEEEAVLQRAIAPLCSDVDYKNGFKDVRLDCRFAAAYSKAISNTAGHGDDYRVVEATGTTAARHPVVHKEADYTTWIERAWVTYFKGSPTGMNHVMMVSNLIRSAQMFSKYPLICVVYGQVEISIDWDPKLFPNLIVIHAGDIKEMGRGAPSFNFNKFRSLMLRIKVGVQLDADMLLGPNCDKLFDATEREITAEYPYPIMPVHWMARYREPNRKIDGYDGYAISYPGDPKPIGQGDKDFPPRIRWAHCHPTWTYHALPFIADALLAKIDYDMWSKLPRVVAGITAAGGRPVKTPGNYMREDEDLLNILLWRYGKHKLWCKWDLEKGLYNNFLNGRVHDEMKDAKWFHSGVPLVFVAMHNTKEVVDSDAVLHRIMTEGANPNYLYFDKKFYPTPEAFKAQVSMDDKPCILI